MKINEQTDIRTVIRSISCPFDTGKLIVETAFCERDVFQ